MIGAHLRFIVLPSLAAISLPILLIGGSLFASDVGGVVGASPTGVENQGLGIADVLQSTASLNSTPVFDIRKTFRNENALGLVARTTSFCEFPTATPTDLFQNLEVGWRHNGSTAAQNQPMGGLSESERNNVNTAMHVVSVAPDRRSMVVELNVLSIFATDLPSYNILIVLSPTKDSTTPCQAQAYIKLGPSSANKTMLIREGLVEVRQLLFVPTGINNINLYGFDADGKPVSVQYKFK